MRAAIKDRDLRLHRRARQEQNSVSFSLPAKRGIANAEGIFGRDNFQDAAWFEKLSSVTISGDFGVPVACAREHHFFLDITFY